MSARTPREIVTAVLVALALTVALDLLGYVVPFVRANLVTLFACVFLYVPQWTLPRNGKPLADYGLTMRDWRRGLPWAAALTVVTFAGFLPGNHLWTTLALDAELHPDPGAWVRPADRFYGAPADAADGRLHLYHHGDLQVLEWRPDEGPWSVEVRTDGALFRPGREPASHALRASGDTPRPVRLQWRTSGGSEVLVSATESGASLPREKFALGGASREPADRDWSDGAARVPLSLAWLPLAIIVQLLLIALPEEFFYRGYLQRRLDELRGRRAWALGPVELSRSNLVVSALFAVGHFAVGLDPLRLAVFFPSLVFGWLRDRTDGIVAPVLYHAACNLMVQLVTVHYW
jgi:hypothetical protein